MVLRLATKIAINSLVSCNSASSAVTGLMRSAYWIMSNQTRVSRNSLRTILSLCVKSVRDSAL